jgi:hypothetical protein
VGAPDHADGRPAPEPLAVRDGRVGASRQRVPKRVSQSRAEATAETAAQRIPESSAQATADTAGNGPAAKAVTEDLVEGFDEPL